MKAALSFHVIKPCLVIVPLLLTVNLINGQNLTETLSVLPWKTENIDHGIILKSVHTDLLYNSRQYLNILFIDKSRQFAIDYEPHDLRVTSSFAFEAKALAAVNAGFFDMKNGGSVTFLKVDDEIINKNTHQGTNITRNCVAIDEKGKLSILPDASPEKLSDPAQFDDVLFTGPLLIRDGQPIEGEDRSFVNDRHPRTAVCTLSDSQALLLTVDGRSTQGAGMSLPELTNVLMALGCKQGINLDGGGSTTMWIDGKGVVNHPSDNRSFDSAGERKVANVLLVY